MEYKHTYKLMQGDTELAWHDDIDTLIEIAQVIVVDAYEKGAIVYTAEIHAYTEDGFTDFHPLWSDAEVEYPLADWSRN